MRFILDLHHISDGVQGELTPEGATEPQPFNSWLELLHLLEPPQRSSPEKGEVDG